MITHEEARQLINCYNEETPENILQDYITQQEKVSKLIELYRKQIELLKDSTWDERIDLSILELEKELGL